MPNTKRLSGEGEKEPVVKYTIKYKTIVLGSKSTTTWGDSTSSFTPTENEITGKNLVQEKYLEREWLTIEIDNIEEVKTGTNTFIKIYRGKEIEYEEDIMEEKVISTSKHYIPLENVFEIIKIHPK